MHLVAPHILEAGLAVAFPFPIISRYNLEPWKEIEGIYPSL